MDKMKTLTNSIIEEGTKVQFGTYPQCRVTDTTLLSSLNAVIGPLPTVENSQTWTSYGYYFRGEVHSYMLYIDIIIANEKYRGVYFDSNPLDYKIVWSSASNGFQEYFDCSNKTVYWFKCDPIPWRVLNVQSGCAFLMANLVLDSQDYHYSISNRTIGGSRDYANNYK